MGLIRRCCQVSKSGLLAGFIISTSFSYTTQLYSFDYLPIGGGGSVPQLIVHPKVKGVIYAKPDVCGPHRWDDTARRWYYLLNTIDWDEGNLHGAQGMAIDPNDASGNLVYAALGRLATSPGVVVKSMDRGKTWLRSNFKPYAGSNSEQFVVERIVVDPNNSDVIYVAASDGYLWRSVDQGLTYSIVPNFPKGNGQPTNDIQQFPGAVMVAVNPAGGTVANPTRSKELFVSVATGAWTRKLIHSTDGGVTWHDETGVSTGPQSMVFSSSGVGYACVSGLRKYQNGTWSDITPPNAGTNLKTVDVHPNDPNKLLVCKWDNCSKVWYSDNAGSTWREVATNMSYKNDVPWYEVNGYCNSATMRANIWHAIFDPHSPNAVLTSNYWTVWRTEDVTATTVSWYAITRGIEITAPMGKCLMSPPSGPNFLVSGIADVGGFAFSSLTEYPTARLEGFNGIDNVVPMGMDFQENNSRFMAMYGPYGYQTSPMGGYSNDYGNTWHKFPSFPTTDDGGRVAISSKSSRTIIAVDQGIYRSNDTGKTWIKATTGPTNNGLGGHRGADFSPLTADKIHGDKFYFIKGTTFYRSTDGGVNWSATVSNLPDARWPKVFCNPLVEGDVWLAMEEFGLYHSTNSGQSFTKLSSVEKAYIAEMGKGPTSTVSSLYVLGTVENTKGIFRTDNDGQSWIRINDASFMPGCRPRGLAVDRQVFGRVYISTNGNGIYYGTSSGITHPRGTVTITPASGTYRDSVRVTLTTDTSGVTIRYTLDGSDPLASSAAYTAPFVLRQSATVKARTFAGSSALHSIASQTYAITSTPVRDTTSIEVTLVATSPVIDGTLEQVWNKATGRSLSLVSIGSPIAAADLSASCKAIATTTHLYVAVSVTDNVIVGASAGSTQPHQLDGIELLIDSDNSKSCCDGQLITLVHSTAAAVHRYGFPIPTICYSGVSRSWLHRRNATGKAAKLELHHHRFGLTGDGLHCTTG